MTRSEQDLARVGFDFPNPIRDNSYIADRRAKRRGDPNNFWQDGLYD